MADQMVYFAILFEEHDQFEDSQFKDFIEDECEPGILLYIFEIFSNNIEFLSAYKPLIS